MVRLASLASRALKDKYTLQSEIQIFFRCLLFLAIREHKLRNTVSIYNETQFSLLVTWLGGAVEGILKIILIAKVVIDTLIAFLNSVLFGLLCELRRSNSRCSQRNSGQQI